MKMIDFINISTALPSTSMMRVLLGGSGYGAFANVTVNTTINTNENTNEKNQEFTELKEKSDLNFYSKLKLKQIDTKSNSKKNVTWDDDKLLNEKLVNNNISLIVEEMFPINQSDTNKMDILITKVDTLIDLITVLTKQLNNK